MGKHRHLGCCIPYPMIDGDPHIDTKRLVFVAEVVARPLSLLASVVGTLVGLTMGERGTS